MDRQASPDRQLSMDRQHSMDRQYSMAHQHSRPEPQHTADDASYVEEVPTPLMRNDAAHEWPWKGVHSREASQSSLWQHPQRQPTVLDASVTLRQSIKHESAARPDPAGSGVYIVEKPSRLERPLYHDAPAADLPGAGAAPAGGLTALLLLLLAGLRAGQREDGEWLAVRDGLLRRWDAMLVAAGLVLVAAAAVAVSGAAGQAAFVLAMASASSALTALALGTGLGFVLRDAPPATLALLSARPALALLALGAPGAAALWATGTLYAAVVCLSFQDLSTPVGNVAARVLTTAGAVLAAALLAAGAAVVRGVEAQARGRGSAVAA